MYGYAGACEGAPGWAQRFSTTVTTRPVLGGIPVGTGRFRRIRAAGVWLSTRSAPGCHAALRHVGPSPGRCPGCIQPHVLAVRGRGCRSCGRRRADLAGGVAAEIAGRASLWRPLARPTGFCLTRVNVLDHDSNLAGWWTAMARRGFARGSGEPVRV